MSRADRRWSRENMGKRSRVVSQYVLAEELGMGKGRGCPGLDFHPPKQPYIQMRVVSLSCDWEHVSQGIKV